MDEHCEAVVGLEGRNHLILETDPGWPVFQEEVRAFLED